MPDHGHAHHGPPDTSRGFEQSDLEFGSIGKGVLFYFIFTAGIGVVVFLGFLFFHQAEVPSQALSAPSAPYPVLQNNFTDRTDIWNLRAREDFVLHNYSYVDATKKAVREPVDQTLDEISLAGPSALAAAPEAPKVAVPKSEVVSNPAGVLMTPKPPFGYKIETTAPVSLEKETVHADSTSGTAKNQLQRGRETVKLLSRFALPIIVLGLVGLSVVFAVSLKSGDVSKQMGLDQKLGNQLPLDTKFKDEYGHNVKLGDYFGKRPVLVMLVFYSCQGACMLEFENATQTFVDMKNKNIGRDYDVLSISINPKETPALAFGKKGDILDHYNRPGGRDGWHFLTGSYDQVQKVAAAIGYRYSYDPLKSQIPHPTGMFVITPDGRISRYLFGVDYVATMISDSIDTAAKGDINVPSDPILFGCLQPDPKTGKIKVNVFRALQVGGFLTIFTVAGLIVMLSRTNSNPKININKEVDLGPGV